MTPFYLHYSDAMSAGYRGFVRAKLRVPVMLMVFRVLCACVLIVACFSQSVVAQQDPRNVRVFLPPAAVIKQQLSLHLENDGIAEAVLVYTIQTNRTMCTTLRESRS